MYTTCAIDFHFDESLSTAELFGALRVSGNVLGDKFKQEDFKFSSSSDERIKSFPLRAARFDEFTIKKIVDDAQIDVVKISQNGICFSLSKQITDEVFDTMSEIVSGAIKSARMLDGLSSVLVTLTSSRQHKSDALSKCIDLSRGYDQGVSQILETHDPNDEDRKMSFIQESRLLLSYNNANDKYYVTVVKILMNPPMMGPSRPVASDLDKNLFEKVNNMARHSFYTACTILNGFVEE